ncbi:MAG: 16S rRNA (adenine(1518)-N(6)/adenine(1519)-N(6))-dimethyltransferase RsmA [Armatimonadota bacterium]
MRESAREQLRRLGVRPRKGLGQHFLVNEGAADAIVASALEEDPDVVLEIGPGLGVLTRRLARSGTPVVAIEKDRAMAAELARIADQHPNLELRYGDILEADLTELTAGRRCVAVGNIPYQITSPLLEKLLTCQPHFAAIVLMVQREVGERLAAEPATSDYGALTLLVRFYAGAPEVVAELAPGSFHPPPQVHSVVLKFIPRDPPIEDRERRELLFAVVKAAFGQRRKQLPNALAGAPGLEIDKSQARQALIRAGIATERRGETLSLEEFAALTEAVEEVAGT